ncbi:MAG: hypothetical protein AAF823_14605 [Planctomycetota bacterium]
MTPLRSIFAVLLAVHFAAPIQAEPAPDSPRPPVSRETTFFTEPLLDDGRVDYIAAINTHRGLPIPPEQNAAIPLLLLVPADHFGPGFQAIAKAMQLTPEPGRLTLASFPTDEDGYRVSAVGRAIRRPWNRADSPATAQWLAENTATLDIVVQAADRPRFTVPLVRTADTRQLIQVLRPHLVFARRAADGLMVRANLALSEGRIDDALRDAHAIRRLGKHLTEDPTFIGTMIGLGVQEQSMRTTLRILSHPETTAAQARQILRTTADQLDHTLLANPAHLHERCVVLDFLQTQPFTSTTDLSRPDPKLAAADPHFDIQEVRTQINARFDRLAPILKRPKMADRIAAMAEDLARAKRHAQESSSSESTASQLAHFTVHDLVTEGLAWLRHPYTTTRDIQLAALHDLVHLAAALRLYRFEHGRFPQSLAELVPRYIADLPTDRYDGRPLTYRPNHAGSAYTLYAVGNDGHDNGGKTYFLTRDPDNFDIAVSHPFPLIEVVHIPSPIPTEFPQTFPAE